MRVTLRNRRQLTLPREVCEALEIKAGDGLSLELVEGALLLRPNKGVALDALRAIQEAFAESGITEEELLESGRQVREELVREKWPHLFPADGPRK
jgi:bifunctional DNA-binding transcriptional regulator/antitoxin component of YhaV-PrlF toxin-antitoxin module